MASRAFDLAGDLKDVIAAFYDDPTSGLSLPERRLVTIGLPAADCELFAVAVESIVPITGTADATTIGSDRDEVAFYMRALVVGLWVLRCVPGLNDRGEIPTVAEEEDAAELILSDATNMELALTQGLDDGVLPGCGGFAFIGWESITAEGYLGGGVLRCQVSIE